MNNLEKRANNRTQLIVGLSLIISVILTLSLSEWFIIISLLFGFGLTKSGITGNCPMTNLWMRQMKK